MNKKMRELQAKILELTASAKSFMEGETKDLAKAEELMDQVDELQKEFDLEERMAKAGKDRCLLTPSPSAPLTDSRPWPRSWPASRSTRTRRRLFPAPTP